MCRPMSEDAGMELRTFATLAIAARRSNPQVKYGVRSPKFIWAPCVLLYSLAETPHLPLPPVFGFIYVYEGAIDQPRKTTSLCDPLI